MTRTETVAHDEEINEIVAWVIDLAHQHQPGDDERCRTDGQPWPCETVTQVAEAIGAAPADLRAVPVPAA